jgi:hypothetical protein
MTKIREKRVRFVRKNDVSEREIRRKSGNLVKSEDIDAGSNEEITPLKCSALPHGISVGSIAREPTEWT